MATLRPSLVSLPHPARAQERDDFVGSQLSAALQRIILRGWLVQKTAPSLLVCGNQRLHLSAKGRLSANGIQVSQSFARFSFQGGGQHYFDFLPTFGCHERASLSFIFCGSLPWAVVHSRFAVAGEGLTATAISLMERLPINGGATVRDCCGSKPASLSRASSNNSRFTSSFCGKGICGSSGSLSLHTPR